MVNINSVIKLDQRSTYQDLSKVKPSDNQIDEKVVKLANFSDPNANEIDIEGDRVKEKPPEHSVETAKKTLKEFKQTHEKFEKGNMVREGFELSLDQATKAMTWLVHGSKTSDNSEGSMWYKIHHKIPEVHMERIKESLKIMEEVGENIELPLIIGMDGYEAWSSIKNIQLQEALVTTLKDKVKTLEENPPTDGSLEKLQVELSGAEEKLEKLNKVSGEHLFSFASSLAKAMVGQLETVWSKIDKLNKAGSIALPFSQEVIDKVGLGIQGAGKGLKLLLALRKAYKLITEDIIPLTQEVNKLDDKIKSLKTKIENEKDVKVKASDRNLRQELKIRKIFLQSGKGWEIAKKAFFTLVDIASAGLGGYEFIALKVLGMAALGSTLSWVGIAIMAGLILISLTLYIYEQSPRLENWFEQRSLKGRVKKLELEEMEITKKGIENQKMIAEVRDNLMKKMGNADSMTVSNGDQDALTLGFTSGQMISKQGIEKRYQDELGKIGEATSETRLKINKLIEQMKTMDKIAQERVFCRKKRMDYETWRGLVIDVSESMANEEVKAYRLKHLEELSKEAKTGAEYDRYRQYVHYFKVDPVKAWVAYMINEKFEDLVYRDPKVAEHNGESCATHAWDQKSFNAYSKEWSKRQDKEKKWLERQKEQEVLQNKQEERQFEDVI